MFRERTPSGYKALRRIAEPAEFKLTANSTASVNIREAIVGSSKGIMVTVGLLGGEALERFGGLNAAKKLSPSMVGIGEN